MKMNRQNPGGEVVTRPTMKGSEKYQARGQGSVLGAYPQIGSNSPCKLEGKTMGGHAYGSKHAGAHVRTSTKGSTVTGSHKACK